MIKLHLLTTPSDPHLCFWLDLLQQQFPLSEQVSAGSIVRMIQQKENGEGNENHIAVALSPETDKPIGMTWFDLYANATAALWYISVAPGQEGHGFGSQIMQCIYDEVFRVADCDFLMMEVERGDSHAGHETPEERETRQKQIVQRNRFYIERHGAWQLTGITYYQQAGFTPPILMDLLIVFNPQKTPLLAQDVFQRCIDVFGDSLTQSGELGLSKELSI